MRYVIWTTPNNPEHVPYVCGAGIDGDTIDDRSTAESMRWVTARDNDNYEVVEYVECAEVA